MSAKSSTSAASGEPGTVSSTERSSTSVPGRPPTRNPFAVARPASAPLLAVVTLLAGLLLGAAGLQFVVIGPANAAHERALADAGLERIADQLARAAAAVRAQVIEAGRAPGTFAAVAGDVDERLAQRETALGALLPGALRVRLHGPGEADIALTESPPLTFAGLDLIRRAELGQLAGPEFLTLERGVVINVAAPIPDDGERTAGSVFVTFEGDDFEALLRSLAADAGRIELVQRFGGGNENVVATAGTGGAGAVLEREVVDTPWVVRLTPAAVAPLASPLVALPLWLLAGLVALVGIGLGHRRLAGAMREDLDRLLESVNAAASGRSPVAGKDYVLDPFAVAGATLAQLTDDLRGLNRPPAPKVKAPTSPAMKGRTASPRSEMTVEEVDDDFLDLGEDEADEKAAETAPPAPEVPATPSAPPAEIFRAYDIRGIVGETLTVAGARAIGLAIGSEAFDRGEQTVLVAADGRHSSPELAAALIEGLTASGRDVVDLGQVPTPILYYGTCETGFRSGVMVTGSHNAANYNGFKIVLDGEALAGDAIAALRERIESGRTTSGEGSVSRRDLVGDYIERITADIALAQPLKVVVDCGNGIAGAVAPRLLESIGCEVIPLYCDVDGDFPNHHPDPADPDNLEDLRTVVRAEGAHLGLAIDGDGDRLGMVTETGEIIWPDRLMMLFARDIVGRNPGADVVFDVKCSRHLNAMIAEFGGRPIMWRTGHSHIKAKMRETGALLGGEFSGHICFGERWYGFDDALYSAARLLEIVAGEALAASELFGEFPVAVSTPEIKVATTEARKFEIMDRLAASGALAAGDVTEIDGLRIDYPDGWGLIRPSNTSPVLTLRFEADSAGALREIAQLFRKALRDIDPDLDFQIPA